MRASCKPASQELNVDTKTYTTPLPIGELVCLASGLGGDFLPLR